MALLKLPDSKRVFPNHKEPAARYLDPARPSVFSVRLVPASTAQAIPFASYTKVGFFPRASPHYTLYKASFYSLFKTYLGVEYGKEMFYH